MSIKTKLEKEEEHSVKSTPSSKLGINPEEQLFLSEDREVGEISSKVLKKIIKALGGVFPLILIGLTALGSNILDYATSYEILAWSKSFTSHQRETSIKQMWLAFIYLQSRNILNGIRGMACSFVRRWPSP